MQKECFSCCNRSLEREEKNATRARTEPVKNMQRVEQLRLMGVVYGAKDLSRFRICQRCRI